MKQEEDEDRGWRICLSGAGAESCTGKGQNCRFAENKRRWHREKQGRHVPRTFVESAMSAVEEGSAASTDSCPLKLVIGDSNLEGKEGKWRGRC